jgi:glucose-6-phosphate isomerase
LSVPKTRAWQALAQYYPAIENRPMRDLLNEDPEQCSRFSIEDPPLFLDYSKNRITAQTVYLLMALALEAKIAEDAL